MVLLSVPFLLNATQDPVTSKDSAEITPKTQTVDFNSPEQQRLAESAIWQSFKANHNKWDAVFNEANGLPHRAYGSAIPVSGENAEAKALNFIESELESFNLSSLNLQLVSAPSTSKHEYINYTQFYQGLEVLNSRLMVKIHSNGVVAFGCDVYPTIELSTTPSISEAAAMASSTEGIDIEILNTEMTSDLKILVLPEAGQTPHLCYVTYVHAIQDNMVPARYKCLVDAHSGQLIYRVDEVKSMDKCPKCKKAKEIRRMGMMNVDIHVSAELYETTLLDPLSTESLPNLQVIIGNETYYTDPEGNLNLDLTGPIDANFALQGLWSQVNTDDLIPDFDIEIEDGSSEITFDGNANVKELSAYRSVNAIHDHMKAWLPDFTGLDYSMPTNIDIAGSCNAFYDGEINFFDAGGGCNATSLIADVVYHEYGHGINNLYYSDNGMNYNNGAMNEGYADWWAISLTDNPHLGEGFFDDTPDGIRRYDIDPKVYPQDLVGEVHADGEIICGAWYDTHLLMGGNWDNTMELFINTYAGFQAVGMNGNEGTIFFDVLLDALQADDDNADLADGTPNDIAIIEGFAIHGIYLLSGAEIIHENPLAMDAEDDLLIDAEVLIQFPFEIYLQEVVLYHKINGELIWSTATMTNTEGDTYQANLGPQEAGTVIAYYIGLIDTYDNLTRVDPVGADAPDPTLPHYTIVGMQKVLEHDGDTSEDFGDWQTGSPDDLATAGVWELNIPIGSFGFPGDLSTIAAPNFDHTGAELAFITGQASNPDGSIFDTDVDDGGTRLTSQIIDLTSFEEPVFSYWRWLAHVPAGVLNFAWSVDISDDGGASWTSIEKTVTQDRQYRRNVFRVSDYIDVTDQFQMRFFADDPIFVGSGALVEAAVDDIYLWDSITTNVAEIVIPQISLFPNPARDQVTMATNLNPDEIVDIRVLDIQGRVVLTQQHVNSSRSILDISGLSNGLYEVVLRTNVAKVSKPLVVK